MHFFFAAYSIGKFQGQSLNSARAFSHSPPVHYKNIKTYNFSCFQLLFFNNLTFRVPIFYSFVLLSTNNQDSLLHLCKA